MKIKVARHIGFCSGVNRAVKIAREILTERQERVFSWGPLIHNSQVIKELAQEGLRIVFNIDELACGSVLIEPSHGIPPSIKKAALKKNIKLISATCPYVKSVHRIIQGLKKEKDMKIIIFGDREHSEVKAFLDLERGAIVIDKIHKISDNLMRNKRVGIISQTTQDQDLYIELITKLLKKSDFKELRIFNTICPDARLRQREAKKMSKKVEMMLVAGGKHSANTKRLTQICRRAKIKAVQLENLRHLNRLRIAKKERLGIISGASTPNKVIGQIIKEIRFITIKKIASR